MSATTARQTAKLVVVGGPDKGMAFRLSEELVHLGRGADNHVALTDPTVAEHQLSIVFRNGRYAIYTPIEQSVAVDDNVIPHARWVWLPPTAKIRVGEKSVLHFSESGEARAARPRDAGGDSVTVEPGKGTGSATAPARKKAAKKDTAVARFITDRPGEALVTLGDDGHLPELKIAEGPDRAAVRNKPKGTSPILVYSIVGFSFLTTIALLLFDTSSGGGGSSSEKQQARNEIREFYGTDDATILPYQQHLRDARLANSRGDRAAERRAYRRVLALLNAEDINRFTGLTGTPERDERLRQLIATLLRE